MRAAVFQRVLFHEGASGAFRAGQLLQAGDVDLHIEVAGVRDDRAIFHVLEMLACAITFLLPVTVQKTSPSLAASSMGITRKPSITASSAFVGSTSVTMTSAPMPRARDGQAAPAPAVAGDHEVRAREQEVGGADDAVDGRLPGAVAVVEQMLGVSVVHGDDGILQHAFLRHGAQPDHAGGGLFGAADHAGNASWRLVCRHRHQVGAVVHGDLRLVIERRHDVRVIGVVVLALDGEDRNAVIAHQAGGNIILRGERVRGAQHHVGAAIAQADRQVRGLGGDVQASRDAHALQRLVLDEFLADDLQDLHRLVGPLDAFFAEIGELEILNVAVYWCGCHILLSPDDDASFISDP